MAGKTNTGVSAEVVGQELFQNDCHIGATGVRDR